MKILKNRNGSTSVLIIMLMVVLMVFGLAVLTTTLSNEKLSLKKQNWLKEYYSLESNVALQLAELDEKLQNVKEKSISGNRHTYSELLLREIDGLDDNLLLELDVTEAEGDYLKHIVVSVQIIIPEENLSDSEYFNNQNFEIVKYNETQDLFIYEDIEYGNPFITEDKEVEFKDTTGD